VIVKQKIYKRSTNHYSHYIAGSRGGLQGNPLEMTRFCLTVHPIGVVYSADIWQL
jgi:hypothetical protein